MLISIYMIQSRLKEMYVLSKEKESNYGTSGGKSLKEKMVLFSFIIFFSILSLFLLFFQNLIEGKEKMYLQHVRMCSQECKVLGSQDGQSVGFSGKNFLLCSPVGAWLVIPRIILAIVSISSSTISIKCRFLLTVLPIFRIYVAFFVVPHRQPLPPSVFTCAHSHSPFFIHDAPLFLCEVLFKHDWSPSIGRCSGCHVIRSFVSLDAHV